MKKSFVFIIVCLSLLLSTSFYQVSADSDIDSWMPDKELQRQLYDYLKAIQPIYSMSTGIELNSLDDMTQEALETIGAFFIARNEPLSLSFELQAGLIDNPYSILDKNNMSGVDGTKPLNFEGLQYLGKGSITNIYFSFYTAEDVSAMNLSPLADLFSTRTDDTHNIMFMHSAVLNPNASMGEIMANPNNAVYSAGYAGEVYRDQIITITPESLTTDGFRIPRSSLINRFDIETIKDEMFEAIFGNFIITIPEQPRIIFNITSITDESIDFAFHSQDGTNASAQEIMNLLMSSQVELDYSSFLQDDNGNRQNYLTINYDSKNYKILSHHIAVGFQFTDVTNKLIVRYVDEEGNELMDEYRKPFSYILNCSSGTHYDTEPKEIAGYELIEIIGEEHGDFTTEDIEVTYVYHRIEIEEEISLGFVNVEYVDINGESLADSIQLSGTPGSKYAVEEKEFENYKQVEFFGEKTGIFTEEVQTVTLVYERIEQPVPQGYVTVFYVDENHKALVESISITGNLGDAYSVVTRHIDGYELLSVSGKTIGTFTTEPQAVIFIYSFIESPQASLEGTLTIKYVDQAGNEIKTATNLVGILGEHYAIEAPVIAGYRLKKTRGETKGAFSTDGKEIVFVYDDLVTLASAGKQNNPLPTAFLSSGGFLILVGLLHKKRQSD